MVELLTPQDLLVVARFGAPFGVRGAIHLRSFTQPTKNFAAYAALNDPYFWRPSGSADQWRALQLIDLTAHKGHYVAKVRGFEQREDLGPLKGAEIAISAARLPAAADGEYYWSELIGRRVVNSDGVAFGAVIDLLETGAHDVLIIRDAASTTQRLIPFVSEFVTQVKAEQIEVEWPADWES